METLHGLLGIFTLQLLSIACGALNDSDEALPDLVSEMIELLTFCNISFSMLLSRVEVDNFLKQNLDGDSVINVDLLDARRGAALAVFWETQRRDSSGPNENLDVLKQCCEAQGLGMVLDVTELVSTLLIPMSYTQGMSISQVGLDFMISILDMYCVSLTIDNVCHSEDAVVLSLQMRPILQRLQVTVMLSPNPKLRQQAYQILMKIITQVLPPTARFETLRDLISNCDDPSLVSLMLTCVKDEVRKAWPPKENEHNLSMAPLDLAARGEVLQSASPFRNQQVLQLIQTSLQTKHGELVEVVSNLDAVVGALNLYRFLLILESSGNTNHTHVLSREELLKGRMDWLLPLREESLRAQSMLDGVEAKHVYEIQLGLDCMMSVLYRCLEIVEDQLAKHPE